MSNFNPQKIKLFSSSSYLQYGADIITTASYQASVEGFCKHLKVPPSEALRLIGQSVSIAHKAKESFLKQPKVNSIMYRDKMYFNTLVIFSMLVY